MSSEPQSSPSDPLLPQSQSSPPPRSNLANPVLAFGHSLIRRVTTLATGPTRLSTTARTITLTASTFLIIFGLGVYFTPVRPVYAQIAHTTLADFVCGRRDPALSPRPSPAQISTCILHWTTRILDIHPTSATALHSSGIPRHLAALPDSPVLPHLQLGLLLSVHAGAVLFLLGVAFCTSLCLPTRSPYRPCCKVPLCLWAALTFLTLLVFLPLTAVLATISVAALKVEPQFSPLSIDSLDLTSSINATVTGVAFPHLDTLSDPSVPSFAVPPKFVAKEVYNQLVKRLLLNTASPSHQPSSPTQAMASLTKPATPSDRTTPLRNLGFLLSVPTILVAPQNATFLCAVQKSFACRGFETGDCDARAGGSSNKPETFACRAGAAKAAGVKKGDSSCLCAACGEPAVVPVRGCVEAVEARVETSEVPAMLQGIAGRIWKEAAVVALIVGLAMVAMCCS